MKARERLHIWEPRVWVTAASLLRKVAYFGSNPFIAKFRRMVPLRNVLLRVCRIGRFRIEGETYRFTRTRVLEPN